MYIAGNGEVYDDEEITCSTIDITDEVDNTPVFSDVDELIMLWEDALEF
jgi:hypothetical protein